MALKFRRGTAAQKSGSLAFGEPYVNTTLGTLQVGLDTGDLTLTSVTTASAFEIQSISASAFISASSIRSTNGITGSIAATNGVVSGSSQITYTGISSIPGGIVSSSVQVLGGTGIVSGSSQVTPLLPTGVISGSSQLNNASIENLTVTNLTTVNETASVLFSSGSNTFGDFGNDTHNFTGSVKISGSLTTIGASTATSFNGTINATNGVVSGSSQITYTGISSIPTGIVSGSSQTIANLPTGTVSGSIQVLGGTGIVSGSSQITYTSISSIPGGIVSSSSQITYTSISSIPGGIVSGSVQVLGGTGIVSGSSQITYASISSIPTGIVSGSAQTIANLPTGVVSGSSQVTLSSTTGGGTSATPQFARLGIGKAADSLITVDISSTVGALQATTTGQSVTAYVLSATNASFDNSLFYGNTTRAGSSAFKLLDLRTNAGSTNKFYVDGNGTGFFASDVTASNFLGGIKSTNGVVSGSSQVNFTQLSGISNGIVSGSTQTIANLPTGTISGSSQVTLSSTTGYGSVLNQAVLTSSSPTFAGLTINGAITATGDITAFYTSDKRHKNNIQLIPNALEKVSKLNGVTWEWNDDVNEVTKSTPKTGLIAQEVQEVLPEVVKTRDDGFLALDYSKMMGLMVEAIKEQQQQIEKLRMDLDNYECKCDNCKSK